MLFDSTVYHSMEYHPCGITKIAVIQIGYHFVMPFHVSSFGNIPFCVKPFSVSHPFCYYENIM